METITLTLKIPVPSNPIEFVLGFMFLVDLIFARRIWISSRKNPINISYALTVFAAGLWTVVLIGVRLFNSPLLISWSVRISYLMGGAIPIFFYLFSHYFPYETKRLVLRHKLLLLLAALFLASISLFPNLMIAGHVLPENRFNPEVSIFWKWIFTCYLVFMTFFGFRNLFLKYKQSNGLWRLRLRQVIIATIVAFIIGISFGMIVPFVYNNSPTWIGATGTIFMAIYIWYNIFWKASRMPRR